MCSICIHSCSFVSEDAAIATSVHVFDAMEWDAQPQRMDQHTRLEEMDKHPFKQGFVPSS